MNEKVLFAIDDLILYAINNQMIDKDEINYTKNKLYDLLQVTQFYIRKTNDNHLNQIDDILKVLLDYAVKQKLIAVDTINQRDIFEAKIMDLILPRPHTINEHFRSLKSPNQKTNYFFDLSKHSNYIKTTRISKNLKWQSKTPYGILDITINLSKPEKDPKDIIKSAQHNVQSKYPKCLLCVENEGYNGLETGIGRTNHRIIPIDLNKEQFYLQYSPYAYYNEHCIVLHEHHQPMKINKDTFIRLFDFVDQFPHYFIGSNADLPIVGGSILNHEHYQGGNYSFPIEHASVLKTYQAKDVSIERLYWPVSVIRLKSNSIQSLIALGNQFLKKWKHYKNETLEIINETKQVNHHTITPIARFKNGQYELDLAFRNNRTTETYPNGIFHPHEIHHHIKKENIGLIEVMGLAILPSRLIQELDVIKDILIKKKTTPESIIHHEAWIETLKQTYTNQKIDSFIADEVALKFAKVLEDAGVFKQNVQGQQAFDDFILDTIKAQEDSYDQIS